MAFFTRMTLQICFDFLSLYHKWNNGETCRKGLAFPTTWKRAMLKSVISPQDQRTPVITMITGVLYSLLKSQMMFDYSGGVREKSALYEQPIAYITGTRHCIFQTLPAMSFT
jgi:hypothetical protein